MDQILEALQTKYEATPELRAGIVGGFYLDHPGPGRDMPFAVAVPIAADPEFNTGLVYEQGVQIQISFFAKKLADVRTTVRAWRRLITYQPMTLPTGRLMAAELTNETAIYEPAGDSNFAAWHYVLEFTFHQLQSLA